MRRRRGERGQATAELALTFPLIIVALLAVTQVALIVRDQLLVVDAAREAARRASVAEDPQKAALAAMTATGFTAHLSVTATTSHGRVRVRVRLDDHPDLPLVGYLFGTVTLAAEATAAVDP